MNKILQDRSFRLSIILTLIFFGTGIIFLFTGLAGYSWVLFVLLPVVLGISIGALPDRGWAYLGASIATLFFLLLLLGMHLSGFICILMLVPLVIPLIFIGSILKHLTKRYREIEDEQFTNKLPVLLLPLLLFIIASPAERLLNDHKTDIVEVRTEQVFHYTPEQVYDAIKSVDTLIAEKPILMNFDLPVPVKCIMDKEEVGGTRTCYFKAGNLSGGDFGGGTITEKITELERGKILKMDVTDYNLIGRKWLGFKDAIYYFDKVGDGSCKVTRITTYTSELSPRIYWEPLEILGIRQEHEYVFNNLANDLKKKYGK